MKKFERLVSIAKDLKSTCQTGRVFVVAFLLKSGKIIQVGVNNYNKTNCISAKYKTTKITANKNFMAGIHGEMQALAKIRHVKDARSYKMVVIRISNTSPETLRCAVPCPNCLAHLLNRGLDSIYYSTDQQTFNKLP
jgi:deoxycytidylate deaminase